MESKFRENGVLIGIAGSFCLLCEKYIAKVDIALHVATSEHKEKLESSVYVDKYKDDRIRKVKAGYYCEPCNILIQTSSKVCIHIGNATHDTNKTYHIVREVDEGLVVFEDILIEKQAWNGQNMESCFVCNVDFHQGSEHAELSSHILNVIQSKLELQKDKFVYRKIGDAFLNCLICNSLITLDSKESHADDFNHIDNYTKCRDNFKNFSLRSAHTLISTQAETQCTENVSCDENGGETDKDNSKTKNDCQKIRNNQVATNHSAKTVNTQIVTKPTETDSSHAENGEEKHEDNMNTETNCIEIATEDHNDIVSPQAAWKNAMQFAKQNHLKYKRTNTYCKVCDVKISSSLLRLKEHVAEKKHQEKAANFSKSFCKKVVKKMPYAEFFFSEFNTKSLFTHNTVINEKFCLSFTSFHTLTKCLYLDSSGLGEKFRCQICEVFVQEHKVLLHSNMWEHMKGVQQASVITDFDNEFIREIRPGVYHCGFCNCIEGSMTSLKQHLESFTHGVKKNDARNRLPVEMETLRKQEQKEIFERLLFGARHF